ncbi:MAG: class I SAM-dependent methyltransferase [Candidatus Geothermincolia bacterium]
MNMKELYRGPEYEPWVKRVGTGLTRSEESMVRRYLKPELSTLEAGTGPGRIVFALRELGFTSLAGFDFLPEFIEWARGRDAAGAIDFQVRDAASLDYPDGSFDQLIYFGQVVSLIPDTEQREAALDEAARILRPGGVALFSSECYEIRRANPIWPPLLLYLGAYRKLRGSSLPRQQVPWLKVGDKVSPGALLDKGPHAYCYRFGELAEGLRSRGLKIMGIGSCAQLRSGSLCSSAEELEGEKVSGTLWIACGKGGTPDA